MATEAPVLARPLALHVSGLDPSTTEVDLYQFIAETQVPVQSIRIIRDEATKNPRYAYVNFSSVEDTEKVLQSLNYRQFKGREISFSHSIPQSHRIPQANLHVAGLPENTSSETLSNAFSIFGPIVSVRVGASKDGVRHNYGYVQFYSETTAAAAVEAASKGPIQIGSDETSLQVNVFKPASERVVKQTNVFVRNFPIAKGEQGFLETVKQFGTITSTCFRSNCLNVTKTGPSETGFGFANYETTEQAEAALAELNKIQVDGFPLQAFFVQLS
jgi:RNA recognition motif-containing protein